ncbi:MAG: hypothetical protein IJ033_05230 [Clostridia bacterium]|nr:hypothetical protein [Clostridia bacterium]
MTNQPEQNASQQNTQELLSFEARTQALNQKYPVSITLKGEIEECLSKNKELLNLEDGLEKALLNVLASRADVVLPKTMVGGSALITSHPKPTTVKQAGQEALSYLRAKKFI